jgi:hypothetical protein
MRIFDIHRRKSGDQVQVSAEVGDLSGALSPFRLWVRFPEALAEQLTDRADPFMTALIPLAMTLGRPMIVEGEVSEQVLAGCRQIMEIWHRWYPHMKIVSLQPSKASEDPFRAEGVAGFFSAGVDSFYTVLKNRARLPKPERIRYLIHIHGADIPLENRPLYGELRAHLEATAETLGAELIPVASNLRDLTRRHVDWFMQDGAGFAAVAHALSPLLRRVFIASSTNIAHAPPWASHPMIDPLWSSETLEFLHDGAEATRLEKILRYVGPSSLAMDHLRVCWDNYGKDYNCCRCPKCLRTMIGLYIAGALDRSKTFDHDIDLGRVRRIPVRDRLAKYYLEDLLIGVRRHRPTPELENALEKALRRFPAVRISVRELGREMDRHLFGGKLRRRHRVAWPYGYPLRKHLQRDFK